MVVALCEAVAAEGDTNTDWNKYDDRLMKAVERREVDKVAAVLGKKGIIPTKLDVEGRSAFHLAATRGHLDCLNLILNHGVDITATDATGKNALHLAARNAQSLCVQKLLQHNCPVGNVDLQGRTALHDAVMAGCASSVKLLCDSGALVNASDFDGRTPLVLATQMCHPHICQLLLERGSDITLRDKQNKTALILGCEYACKDAVDVLLKHGADVTAVDSSGHDSYHYARLSKNQELVSLVKSYLDSATKAKEAAKMEQKKRQLQSAEMVSETTNREKIIQDLEKKNESQQETLKKIHQDQRTLLDKVNMLQHQLSQKNSAVEDIHKEREQLKLLLSAKEKEEGARAVETVRVQQRSHLGDYPGQSVIKGKDNVLVRQSHSLDSAQILQPTGPSRSVARPLELSRPVAGDPETLRQELECVRRQQETAQEEVGRLQKALACKSQECEELTRKCETIKCESDQQIHELEEAMGDVQKRMIDSEAKVKQLQAHVVAVKEHLNNQVVDDLKAQLNEVKAKYEGASAEVGRVRNHLKQSEKALEEYKKGEGLLAVEVESLTAELSAMREDHKNMEETLLNMEGQVKTAEGRLTSMVKGEKFDNMKNLLTNAVDEKELQLAELREDYDRVLEEVAELHRVMDDRQSVPLQEHERVRAALEEQTSTLKKKLADVTAKCQSLICEVEEENHEEVKRSMGLAVEELTVRLAEETEKRKQAEEQLQRLQEEKTSLCENIANLRSMYIPCERYESEVATLTERNTELEGDLNSLQDQYHEKNENERVQTELNEALEKAKIEIAKLEDDCRVREEELQMVKEGNAMLNEEFEKVQAKLENDSEGRAQDAYSKYQCAQETASKLHKEIEAQKKELDTIMEALQLKFVPLTAMEEKEMHFNTALKDLAEKLAEMQEIEKYKEVEDRCKGQVEELSLKLVELEQQYKEFEAMQSSLSGSLQEAQKECMCLREAHRLEVQRVHELEKQLQSQSFDEAQYSQVKAALEREVNELRMALREEEETNAQRAEDVATLQTELLRATHALDDLNSHEEQVTQLRAEKHKLEEEVRELGNRLSGLDEQYEDLYRETTHAREGEKRARAETEALQVKSASIEKEIRDLKERYEESMSTIGDLQKRIQASSEQTERKDKRITELLADVERLKQALNGLSQLAYAGNAPNKRQTQHIDTLQAQVKSLQQQLADAERQHREVVSIYRTHLLSAAQ
ncbi:hypothetical protein cypCar_00027415, partial [Cyprinus carpio]